MAKDGGTAEPESVLVISHDKSIINNAVIPNGNKTTAKVVELPDTKNGDIPITPDVVAALVGDIHETEH